MTEKNEKTIPSSEAVLAQDRFQRIMDYETACNKVRESNTALLDGFEAWLKISGLSEKTIANHLSNVNFYINEFLLREHPIEAKDGPDMIDAFLGDWFIRKTTWSSPLTIKGNAASLKKFYTFMLDQDLIDLKDFDELKKTIKQNMPAWLAAMERNDALFNE